MHSKVEKGPIELEVSELRESVTLSIVGAAPTRPMTKLPLDSRLWTSDSATAAVNYCAAFLDHVFVERLQWSSDKAAEVLVGSIKTKTFYLPAVTFKDYEDEITAAASYVSARFLDLTSRGDGRAPNEAGVPRH